MVLAALPCSQSVGIDQLLVNDEFIWKILAYTKISPVLVVFLHPGCTRIELLFLTCRRRNPHLVHSIAVNLRPIIDSYCFY